MWFVYFFVLFCAVGGVTTEYVASPVIITKAGAVQGFVTNHESFNITTFRGIRYGKAPTDLRRFMKPEPADPWNGVLNATHFGTICYQSAFLDMDIFGVEEHSEMSEDCLFLNVYIPGSLDEALAQPKPVMAFIHGGGFAVGSSNLYVADMLAGLGDTIVVTFNYRLDVFGFLTSDDGSIPGNIGLFDQHLALTWIHGNIAAFGGDPESVTIFGQSAGGLSVLGHVISPLSQNLFHRAIIQSSPIPIAKSNTQLYDVIKKVSGCPTEDIKSCLQHQSPGELLKLGVALVSNSYSFFAIDGEFITDDPYKLLIQGKFDTGKPVMVGYTSGDGDVMVQSLSPMMDTTWENIQRNGLAVSHARTLVPIAITEYLQDQNPANIAAMSNLVYQKYLTCGSNVYDTAYSAVDMFTDSIFGSLALELSRSVAYHGGKIYLYQFDHVLGTFMKPEMKVRTSSHSMDLTFVFGSTFLVEKAGFHFTEAEHQLSRSIIRALSEFAKTGKPRYLDGQNQSHEWNSFTLSGYEYLHMTDDMTKASVRRFPVELVDRIEFWTQVLNRINKMATCDPYTDTGHTPPTRPNGQTTVYNFNMATFVIILISCTISAVLSC